MSELLACPFCGGEPDMHSNSDGTTIHCTNDQCISHPLPFNDWGHEADAVAAWNKRTSQSEIARLRTALEGAIGALEFSRDYHSDLGNEEQAFAQDRLDAALAALSAPPLNAVGGDK